MIDSRTLSKPASKLAGRQGSWQSFLVLALLANAAIWATALLYLKYKAPTYTSHWAITIPGAGSAANVNLPNIGQASFENSSPYATLTQDPRQNYKAIAQSEPVMRAAAAELKTPPEKFGQPRVTLPDSTTIMEFEFKGASPQEARHKSLALYDALQARLRQLRVEELAQRNKGFEGPLKQAQQKLEVAQERLSAYKARSGLESGDQIKALSLNIEDLRRKRAETVSQQQQAVGSVRELSASLNLSAQRAAEAFALQTDQIFQQDLKNYSEASAGLVVLGSKFTSDHPTVIAEIARRDAAQKDLQTRGQSLLGRPVSLTALQQLNLVSNSNNSDSGRQKLFQDLVGFQTQQQGLGAGVTALDQQITQLEDRRKLLAQEESTLNALQRDVQVTEAVFSSTVTRLDIGSSNAFGSYPLIQMIAEPSLDETPSSPKKQFILLGAALGSLFLTAGLTTLWLRKRTQVDKPVNRTYPEDKEIGTVRPAHTQGIV